MSAIKSIFLPVLVFMEIAPVAAPSRQDLFNWTEIEQVCGNPNLAAGCTGAGRRERLARFGIPPLDQLHKRQTETFGDSELIVAMLETRAGSFALIFERRADPDPLVEIRGPLPRDRSRRQKRYVAKMTEAAWRDIAESGRSFDTPYFDDVVCIGGGAIYTIETVDKAGRTRARIATPCEGGAVIRYFEVLSDAAFQQLRPCQRRRKNIEDLGSYDRLFDCVADRQ